jgi:repressor LexA
MRKLTDRQRSILEFIQEFIDTNEYPPTIREIQAEFSINGTAAVTDHLCSIEWKGYIKRVPRVSRGIKLVKRV